MKKTSDLIKVKGTRRVSEFLGDIYSEGATKFAAIELHFLPESTTRLCVTIMKKDKDMESFIVYPDLDIKPIGSLRMLLINLAVGYGDRCGFSDVETALDGFIHGPKVLFKEELKSLSEETIREIFARFNKNYGSDAEMDMMLGANYQYRINFENVEYNEYYKEVKGTKEARILQIA